MHVVVGQVRQPDADHVGDAARDRRVQAGRRRGDVVGHVRGREDRLEAGVAIASLLPTNWYSVPGETPARAAIESSIPVLMFCIVYGLSMDCEVFVVSRTREEYLSTRDTRRAVALGLQRSGPRVTAAAVILAASFAVYATGGVVYLKMIGVGMVVAVLVDAVLIRGVLLPAFIRLAGSANWWAPASLRRVHERFGISEAAPPVEPDRQPAMSS